MMMIRVSGTGMTNNSHDFGSLPQTINQGARVTRLPLNLNLPRHYRATLKVTRPIWVLFNI